MPEAAPEHGPLLMFGDSDAAACASGVCTVPETPPADGGSDEQKGSATGFDSSLDGRAHWTS